jgi:hypothetical protein
MSVFKVDQRVKSLFERENLPMKYYYGKIRVVNDDGTFDVQFDDSRYETNMTKEELVSVIPKPRKTTVNSMDDKENQSPPNPQLPNPQPPTSNAQLYRHKLTIIPKMPAGWNCLECWCFFHDDATGKEKVQRPHVSKAKGNMVCLINFLFY